MRGLYDLAQATEGKGRKYNLLLKDEDEDELYR